MQGLKIAKLIFWLEKESLKITFSLTNDNNEKNIDIED